MSSEGDECVRGRRGPFDGRPVTAPDFLLSRSHGSVRTQGSLATYTDPWLAAERLRRGEHQMVVGAIPFKVPIQVDVAAGANWLDAAPLGGP